MSGILDGLRDAAKASACTHEFEYLRAHSHGDGVVGRCLKCRCRFTAWPGTAHYDEIVRARGSNP